MDLAREMAANHVYLSSRSDQFNSASRYLLKSGRVVPDPARIVVVVGAGVSAAACSLPAGKEAAKALTERITDSGVSRRLVQDEIRRITVEYRLEETDFEAVLLALSKFDQKRLLEELQGIFLRRYYPSTAYEILAHLLKHRFIDAIINFNFDEILDQALDDELRSDGYYSVRSDGDCPGDISQWIDETRPRFCLPLYIKPHGTASHKSSLRFTRSSYSLLPEEIVALLEKLLDGACRVVVLGHAMQSVEFNHILARSGHNYKLLFIDPRKPRLRELKVDSGPPHWSIGLNEFDRALQSLWRQIEKNFERAPRGIDRHLLISRVFRRNANWDSKSRATDPDPHRHLLERAVVEVALAAAKAKGMLSLEELADDRAGRYLRLYHERTRKEEPSLRELCMRIGLTQLGYSPETVCINPSGSPLVGVKRLALPEKERQEAIKCLISSVEDQLTGERQKRAKETKSLLRRTLEEMFAKEDVEVSPNPRAIHVAVYHQPRVLPTLSALRSQTNEFFFSKDWNAILAIAETGEFLLEPTWAKEIKKRKAALAVVVADELKLPELKRIYKKKMKSRWLHWWLHNTHVTVFLSDGRASHALVFERRLRASHIVPVVLEDDAEMAVDIFAAYWLKADRDRRERFISPRNIQAQKTKLIEWLGPRTAAS